MNVRVRNFLPAFAIVGMVSCLSFGAQAQGYGEQRPLGFSVSNQNDGTRITREGYRQSVSQSNRAAKSGGSGSTLGGNLGGLAQQGSDLNNVVQYYNYSSTYVAVPGNNSPVSVGGTLNAGQTSTGTSQVLNNSSASGSGGTIP